MVTEANAPERLFAVACLMEDLEELSQLELIWVDAGYTGENLARVVRQLCNAKVDVIKRSDSGFQVLSRRWVVERTFSWLVSTCGQVLCRRLSLTTNCYQRSAKPSYTLQWFVSCYADWLFNFYFINSF